MTLFAINSQAYREISIKAENMCRAQKIAEQKKKWWESIKWEQQPRTACLKSSILKYLKAYTPEYSPG